MNDETLPLYELGKQQPVAWLNREGKLVGADPECLPRILFADVPVMMHLTCGVSLERRELGSAPLSDEAAQGTGAYLTLAVESLESQLTAAEATMREVANQIRWTIQGHERENNTNAWLAEVADRLDPPPKTLSLEGGGRLCDDPGLDPPPVVECDHDWVDVRNQAVVSGGLCTKCGAVRPPPVVEKPLHAYFPSDVNAGSRSLCVHCGQAYDAHVPPPVVENPPA